MADKPLTRAQALAVQFDEAEEADDYTPELAERVARALPRLGIVTGWRHGQRLIPGSKPRAAQPTSNRVCLYTSKWAAQVCHHLFQWEASVNLHTVENLKREVQVLREVGFESEDAARRWCDEKLRAAEKVFLDEHAP